MIGPWSELYLYRPNSPYHSGRLSYPRPFLDEVKSALNRYEELERPRPIANDFDPEWCQQFPTRSTFVGDVVAMLLILLVVWGSTMLLHRGSAELQAEQPVASMAKALESANR